MFKSSLLTLIGPGEVKVNLGNSDLKGQENLPSTLFKKYLFLQKYLRNLFTSHKTSKNDVLMYIL